MGCSSRRWQSHVAMLLNSGKLSCQSVKINVPKVLTITRLKNCNVNKHQLYHGFYALVKIQKLILTVCSAVTSGNLQIWLFLIVSSG